MDVLFLSPGYPYEMPFFVRALAQAGARVLGVGDGPALGLPDWVRPHLHAYLQVDCSDPAKVLAAVKQRFGRPDRIEALWEPRVMLAAYLREQLGVPGLLPATAHHFRDKGAMKAVLRKHGVRVPRSGRATTQAEVRELAHQVGYPLVVKPIDGAGSAHTHRLDSEAQLEAVLPTLGGVAEVSVEEYIEGEEYTVDALVKDDVLVWAHVNWYRPKPIVARNDASLSPQDITVRRWTPRLQAGVELAKQATAALRPGTGFIHLEWFSRPDGEAVFGECAARVGGAHLIDNMNYATDRDWCRAWAELVVGRHPGPQPEMKYNVAVIFKRARGQGTIRAVEGLDEVKRACGRWLVVEDLLPIGARRRDWKATLKSDGHLIVRHPDLDRCLEMADLISDRLVLRAG